MTLSNSNHLPKALLNFDGLHPFNTSHWWLNFSTWTLGRYIQAIVVWNISGGIHMKKKLEMLVAIREEYWVAGDRVRRGMLLNHHLLRVLYSLLWSLFSVWLFYLTSFWRWIQNFCIYSYQHLHFYLSTRQPLPWYWANPLSLLKDISVQNQAQWYMPVIPMT